MYNFEPQDYKCPFCLLVKGVEGEFPYSKHSDIFYHDDELIGFIASHQWPNNHGHALIAPRQHIENIFDMPDTLLARTQALAKQISLAMKEAYGCDGVSTRQHNGPDGGQDVWHFHLQVLPRYKDDQLYLRDKERALQPVEERGEHARLLAEWFAARNS